MKYLGLFIFVFFNLSALVFSQKNNIKKPNYKKIKKITFKKKSDFYYLKLAKKFTTGMDMTLEEKRVFYYGFAFRHSYKPYKVSKDRKEINTILHNSIFNKETLNKLDVLLRNELINNPFDLELHNLHIFVYKKLRQKNKIAIKLKQIQVIKDAILSSGNGKSKKTAYHVIFIKNEYDILKLLKLKEVKYQFVDKNFECIFVQSNPQNIEKVYFNITMCAKKL